MQRFNNWLIRAIRKWLGIEPPEVYAAIDWSFHEETVMVIMKRRADGKCEIVDITRIPSKTHFEEIRKICRHGITRWRVLERNIAVENPAQWVIR